MPGVGISKIHNLRSLKDLRDLFLQVPVACPSLLNTSLRIFHWALCTTNPGALAVMKRKMIFRFPRAIED